MSNGEPHRKTRIWLYKVPVRGVVVGEINPDTTAEKRLEIIRQKIIDIYTPHLTREAMAAIKELPKL